MNSRWILFLMLILTGCSSPRKNPPASAEHRLMALAPEEGPAVQSRDARPDVPMLIHLDIYQLTVPYGTVSLNEEFWKRINEDCIDVGTRDLLLRNGIRVGESPIGEWSIFKNIIDQNPSVSRHNSFAATEAKAVELQMKTEADVQNIFYYDRNGLRGRTFDPGEYLMSLSFQPAPRKFGEVRIALCPVVRTSKRRLEYTAMNQEIEIQYARPERLYEVNLRADIPLESFLIIAPSPQVQASTSLGSTFLIKEGAAERFEQILLLVPKPYRLDESKTIMKAAMPGS